MNSTARPTPEELAQAEWRTSLMSSSNGGCLEVAQLGGWVAIRDNEDLGNPPLVVTRHVWICMLDGAKKGEFDPPAIA